MALSSASTLTEEPFHQAQAYSCRAPAGRPWLMHIGRARLGTTQGGRRGLSFPSSCL